MFGFQSFMVASAALSLFSGVSSSVVKRNGEPPAPSCTDYTPFVYAGCYSDPSNPRGLLYASGLDSQTMTVDKCVAFCKGNKYKYAGLEYYGQCYCGATVYGKALDESQCSFPCTGNKGQICGGNDIISIYQDPTFPAVDNTIITDYKPLGCYSEGTSGRSLAWRQDQIAENAITVTTCLLACKLGGYSFAGVEYGSQCYCGEVLGNGTLPIAASTCNMPCNGDKTGICGGPSALNLYVATDLESSEPCGYVPPPPPSSTTTPPAPPRTTTSAPPPPPTTTAPPPPPPPPTTTAPPPPPTTKVCSSVVTVPPPAPTCVYKCGNWCAQGIPEWSDKDTCVKAVASCAIQVSACFLHAGFPDSLNCFKFSSWCTSLTSYCQQTCAWGKCSKGDCFNKNPPQGGYLPPPPTYSTVTFACTTTAAPTVPATTASPTTCVPIPTVSNICKQPNNPGKGYSWDQPVGSISLPCLTCNNVLQDYKQGNCFKLYSYKDTFKCPSYGRGGSHGPTQACKDSCDIQYESCKSVYAEGCKKNWKRTFGPFGGDNYWGAMSKCKDQWNDCYNSNNGVNVGSRCNSWNQGWS